MNIKPSWRPRLRPPLTPWLGSVGQTPRAMFQGLARAKRLSSNSYTLELLNENDVRSVTKFCPAVNGLFANYKCSSGEPAWPPTMTSVQFKPGEGDR